MNRAIKSSVVGFSRIGKNRELKRALERCWKGMGPIGSDEEKNAFFELQRAANDLQLKRWSILKDLGLDIIPSGDYSYYDHVLDMAFALNAIPKKYRTLEEKPGLRTYFAMARGEQQAEQGVDMAALPMSKWFDTNYHYIVPEITADQQFSLNHNKFLEDYNLAYSELSLKTKPVLIGPITFLKLSDCGDDTPLSYLPKILPIYEEILESLLRASAEWIQFDEPIFVTELDQDYHFAFYNVYSRFQNLANTYNAHIVIATYYGSVIDSRNSAILSFLPAQSVFHVDLTRSSTDQLDSILSLFPTDVSLSLGLINGRNIWIDDFSQVCHLVKKAVSCLGVDLVQVSTSCNLLHVPYSVALEPEYSAASEQVLSNLTSDLASLSESQVKTLVLRWLAFGIEKIEHLVGIANLWHYFDNQMGSKSAEEFFSRNRSVILQRESYLSIENSHTAAHHAKIDSSLFRSSPYEVRLNSQRGLLPILPTTTIGSFPQFPELRTMRSAFDSGSISKEKYDDFVNQCIRRCIEKQEEIGLDVLVHGEFERTDMVEYFAKNLDGFIFTRHGWIQSYGSRCFRPGIIFGNVTRPRPMTVDTWSYAQSLTNKPVKGMLTGPTTILQWSFVRNDKSFSDIHLQLSLAIREEVLDLESAGCSIIQVDEPAFREGLPLLKRDRAQYLRTVVDGFRVATGVSKDETQIHTHMCYSKFSDIKEYVAQLDADVLCIECSRSDSESLRVFSDYPFRIGPGVYDIHSPRIPTLTEVLNKLEEMARVIPIERLFVNPDCGLKTRTWEQAEDALKVMANATHKLRETIRVN